MKVEIGKVLKEKDELDNKFVYCTVENYNRDKYLNRRLLLRVLFILPLSFLLGNLIYYNITTTNSLIKAISSFAISYIIIFYLSQIPYELIRLIVYPNFYNNDDVKIKLLNRNRLITVIYTGPISELRLFISILLPPLIVFSLIATLIFNYGNNIVLYGALAANLVLASDNFLNVLLFLKFTKQPKKMNVITNSHKEI